MDEIGASMRKAITEVVSQYHILYTLEYKIMNCKTTAKTSLGYITRLSVWREYGLPAIQCETTTLKRQIVKANPNNNSNVQRSSVKKQVINVIDNNNKGDMNPN